MTSISGKETGSKILVIAIVMALFSAVAAAADFQAECANHYYLNESSGPSVDYCGSNSFFWNGSSGITSGVNGISKSSGSWGSSADALDFDGSQGYATVDNGIQGSWTISMWVKADEGVSSTRQKVLWIADPDNNYKISPTIITDGTFDLRYETGGTTNFLDGVNISNHLNTWNNFVFTYNDSTNNISYYHNGSLLDTATTSGSFSLGNKISYFANQKGQSRYYDGGLDEISFYSTYSNSTEAANLHKYNRRFKTTSYEDVKVQELFTEPENLQIDDQVNVTAQVNNQTNIDYVVADVFENGSKLVDNASLSNSDGDANFTVDNLFTADEEVLYEISVTAKGVQGEKSVKNTSRDLSTSLSFHSSCNRKYYLNETSGPSIDYCGSTKFYWNGSSGLTGGITGISKTSGSWGSSADALDFDGSNGYGTMGTGFSGSWTLNLWLKPDEGISSSRQKVAWVRDSITDHKITPTIRTDGTFKLRYNTGGGAQFLETVNISNHVNEWNHFVFTFNSSSNNISYYHEGNLVDSATTSNDFDLSGQTWYVGNQPGQTRHYDGGLDELALYNLSSNPNQVDNFYTYNRRVLSKSNLLSVSTTPSDWTLNQAVDVSAEVSTVDQVNYVTADVYEDSSLIVDNSSLTDQDGDLIYNASNVFTPSSQSNYTLSVTLTREDGSTDVINTSQSFEPLSLNITFPSNNSEFASRNLTVKYSADNAENVSYYVEPVYSSASQGRFMDASGGSFEALLIPGNISNEITVRAENSDGSVNETIFVNNTLDKVRVVMIGDVGVKGEGYPRYQDRACNQIKDLVDTYPDGWDFMIHNGDLTHTGGADAAQFPVFSGIYDRDSSCDLTENESRWLKPDRIIPVMGNHDYDDRSPPAGGTEYVDHIYSKYVDEQSSGYEGNDSDEDLSLSYNTEIGNLNIISLNPDTPSYNTYGGDSQWADFENSTEFFGNQIDNHQSYINFIHAHQGLYDTVDYPSENRGTLQRDFDYVHANSGETGTSGFYQEKTGNTSNTDFWFSGHLHPINGDEGTSFIDKHGVLNFNSQMMKDPSNGGGLATIIEFSEGSSQASFEVRESFTDSADGTFMPGNTYVFNYSGTYSLSETFTLDYQSSDTTPPSSSDNWTASGFVDKSETVIELTASDDDSGVEDIYYRVNGGSYSVVQGSTATVTINTQGNNTLEYYAEDSAGNVEATNTEHVALDSTDSTPPSTTDDYTQTGFQQKSQQTVTLTASDTESSVANISYRVNGGSYNTVESASTDVLIDTTGNNTLEYFATDTKGNQESVNTEYVALRPLNFERTVDEFNNTGLYTEGYYDSGINSFDGSFDAGGNILKSVAGDQESNFVTSPIEEVWQVGERVSMTFDIQDVIQKPSSSRPNLQFRTYLDGLGYPRMRVFGENSSHIGITIKAKENTVTESFAVDALGGGEVPADTTMSIKPISKTSNNDITFRYMVQRSDGTVVYNESYTNNYADSLSQTSYIQLVHRGTSNPDLASGKSEYTIDSLSYEPYVDQNVAPEFGFVRFGNGVTSFQAGEQIGERLAIQLKGLKDPDGNFKEADIVVKENGNQIFSTTVTQTGTVQLLDITEIKAAKYTVQGTLLDEKGKTTTFTESNTVQEEKPVINLQAPADGETLTFNLNEKNNKNVEFDFQIEDNNNFDGSYSILLNGSSIKTGSFTASDFNSNDELDVQTFVDVSPGTYNHTLQVTNSETGNTFVSSGNLGQTTFTVEGAEATPTVTIDSPTEGETVFYNENDRNDADVTVSGSVDTTFSGNADVLLDGATVASFTFDNGTTSYSESLTAGNGSHDVKISLTSDTTGTVYNSSTRSFTVEGVDEVPPKITVTQPDLNADADRVDEAFDYNVTFDSEINGTGEIFLRHNNNSKIGIIQDNLDISPGVRPETGSFTIPSQFRYVGTYEVVGQVTSNKGNVYDSKNTLFILPETSFRELQPNDTTVKTGGDSNATVTLSGVAEISADGTLQIQVKEPDDSAFNTVTTKQFTGFGKDRSYSVDAKFTDINYPEINGNRSTSNNYQYRVKYILDDETAKGVTEAYTSDSKSFRFSKEAEGVVSRTLKQATNLVSTAVPPIFGLLALGASIFLTARETDSNIAVIVVALTVSGILIRLGLFPFLDMITGLPGLLVLLGVLLYLANNMGEVIS